MGDEEVAALGELFSLARMLRQCAQVQFWHVKSSCQSALTSISWPSRLCGQAHVASKLVSLARNDGSIRVSAELLDNHFLV